MSAFVQKITMTFFQCCTFNIWVFLAKSCITWTCSRQVETLKRTSNSTWLDFNLQIKDPEVKRKYIVES